MSLSVLIPSHGRPGKLRRCLDGLANQTLAPAEVRVALDGGDPEDARKLEAGYADALSRLVVTAVPRAGYMPARQALLDAATADLTLSLNDDVVPAPTLIAAHAALHAAGTPTVGVGHSPWIRPDAPTRFDEIATHTNLVFFDPVAALAAGQPLTYRHAVGLNLSFGTRAARELGGFADFPFSYGYEDIEMAWKLCRHAGAAIVFAPDARADHDHRYTALDVMRREYHLGRAAWQIAAFSPGFAAELFGRDIRHADELTYSRGFLRHQRIDAERTERRFLALDHQPADPARPGEESERDAEHWVMLKRYLWRWGLCDAAEGVAARFSVLGQDSGG
mgnify:CR=1 FL=1